MNCQTDASQTGGNGLDPGVLMETRAVYEKGPFSLRTLYAEWNFDGSAVQAAGADRQWAGASNPPSSHAAIPGCMPATRTWRMRTVRNSSTSGAGRELPAA